MTPTLNSTITDANLLTNMQPAQIAVAGVLIALLAWAVFRKVFR